MSQIGFFDGSNPLKITKPIRLIECFAVEAPYLTKFQQHSLG